MAKDTVGTPVQQTPAGKVATTSDKRSASRLAKTTAEFAARGGRELTDAEKLQINALHNAEKACKVLRDRITNGRAVDLGVVSAAAQLYSSAFGSMRDSVKA